MKLRKAPLPSCNEATSVLRGVVATAVALFVLFFLLGSVLCRGNNHLPEVGIAFKKHDAAGASRNGFTGVQVDANVQAWRKRHALESSEGASSSSVRLRLMHRDSPRSPVRKLHKSRLEALREAREMDMARLRGFDESVKGAYAAAMGSSGADESVSGDAGEGSAGDLREGERQAAWRLGRSAARTLVRSGAAAGAGQYFVDFYIGTPAKRFLLIVDTGSDLVWVRCSRSCSSSSRCSSRSRSSSEEEDEEGDDQEEGGGDAAAAALDPGSSATFSPIPCLSKQCLLVPSPPHFSCNFHLPASCRYDYVYADLSDSSGIFALETVTLNSSSSGEGEEAATLRVSNVAFGCGLRNIGQSFVGSGGVMGLGRGSISFASQIGSSLGNRFSYCFVDFFRLPAQDSFLVFGNASSSSSQLQGPLQSTPFLRNPYGESFYYIGIQGVRVDGELLPIPSNAWEIDAAGNGGTVIDSGTTLTFFVEPAYRRILEAMSSALIYPQIDPLQTFDLCFNSSGISSLKLPKLSIILQGNACFDPPPNNYFIDVVAGVKCLGLQEVESPVGFSVLGNLLQQNFLVEYDRDNEQLAFAPTVCSATQ